MFKKAGELVDYSDKSFDNIFGISKVTFSKKIHTYCRLGGDIYTNNIKGEFNPGSKMCDYVYLEKAMDDRFEQTDSIIEEVLAGIVEIIKNQCPDASDIHLSSYVEDSIPKDFPVLVEVNV